MLRLALTLVLASLLACNDKGGTTDTDTTTADTTGPTTGTVTASSTDTPTGAPTTGTPTGSTPTTDTPDDTTGPHEHSSSGSGTSDQPDATTSTTTSPGTTTINDDTTGGASGLKISLTDVDIFANCQPAIPPDPMVGNWTLVYDNSSGAATSAELTSAIFFIAEGDPPIGQIWDVSPTASGPIAAGEIVMKPTQKLKGDAFPDCEFCGAPTSLILDFIVDGEQVFIDHKDTLKCVQ